jgi:hypothetical protein
MFSVVLGHVDPWIEELLRRSAKLSFDVQGVKNSLQASIDCPGIQAQEL